MHFQHFIGIVGPLPQLCTEFAEQIVLIFLAVLQKT
jgi:hypothetical protein